MADDTASNNTTNSKVKQITANTQIIFTVKSFFGLITSILALFFGFYLLVVNPKVDKTEKHYELMFLDQKEQNRVFYEKLGDIDKSIVSLNSTIKSLSDPKIKYQSVANIDASENSGGLLSGAN